MASSAAQSLATSSTCTAGYAFVHNAPPSTPLLTSEHPSDFLLIACVILIACGALFMIGALSESGHDLEGARFGHPDPRHESWCVDCASHPGFMNNCHGPGSACCRSPVKSSVRPQFPLWLLFLVDTGTSLVPFLYTFSFSREYFLFLCLFAGDQ